MTIRELVGPLAAFLLPRMNGCGRCCRGRLGATSCMEGTLHSKRHLWVSPERPPPKTPHHPTLRSPLLSTLAPQPKSELETYQKPVSSRQITLCQNFSPPRSQDPSLCSPSYEFARKINPQIRYQTYPSHTLCLIGNGESPAVPSPR